MTASPVRFVLFASGGALLTMAMLPLAGITIEGARLTGGLLAWRLALGAAMLWFAAFGHDYTAHRAAGILCVTLLVFAMVTGGARTQTGYGIIDVLSFLGIGGLLGIGALLYDPREERRGQRLAM